MLDIVIVAHDEDVDTEKVSHSTRDSKRGRFRAGRDDDCEPRPRLADFLGRHSPQQLTVQRVPARAALSASEMSGGAGNGRTVAWSAHDDEFRLAISH
jgi:hypothetical protein